MPRPSTHRLSHGCALRHVRVRTTPARPPIVAKWGFGLTSPRPITHLLPREPLAPRVSPRLRRNRLTASESRDLRASSPHLRRPVRQALAVCRASRMRHGNRGRLSRVDARSQHPLDAGVASQPAHHRRPSGRGPFLGGTEGRPGPPTATGTRHFRRSRSRVDAPGDRRRTEWCEGRLGRRAAAPDRGCILCALGAGRTEVPAFELHSPHASPAGVAGLDPGRLGN